jgi:hypothetical protein
VCVCVCEWLVQTLHSPHTPSSTCPLWDTRECAPHPFFCSLSLSFWKSSMCGCRSCTLFVLALCCRALFDVLTHLFIDYGCGARCCFHSFPSLHCACSPKPPHTASLASSTTETRASSHTDRTAREDALVADVRELLVRQLIRYATLLHFVACCCCLFPILRSCFSHCTLVITCAEYAKKTWKNSW